MQALTLVSTSQSSTNAIEKLIFTYQYYCTATSKENTLSLNYCDRHPLLLIPVIKKTYFQA